MSSKENRELRLYVLIRSDLQCSIGKLLVHIGHVCSELTMNFHESELVKDWYWNNAQTKIILKVNTLKELDFYYKKSDEMIHSIRIKIADEGFYELQKGTIVCCGILCSKEEAIDKGLNKLRLWK